MSKDISGLLVVRACGGRDITVVQKIGKQDPYLEFQLGDENQRTHTDNNGGHKPMWGQAVKFDLNNEKELLVKCIDKNPVHNSFIGQAEIQLDPVLENHQYDGWFEIKNKDTPAGDIYLELTFYPSDGTYNPRPLVTRGSYIAHYPVSQPNKTTNPKVFPKHLSLNPAYLANKPLPAIPQPNQLQEKDVKPPKPPVPPKDPRIKRTYWSQSQAQYPISHKRYGTAPYGFQPNLLYGGFPIGFLPTGNPYSPGMYMPIPDDYLPRDRYYYPPPPAVPPYPQEMASCREYNPPRKSTRPHSYF